MLKKIEKIKYIFLVVILSWGQVVAAFENNLKIKNPGLGGDLETMLHQLLIAIVKISIPFLVLAFVYIGFLFVKAQGNPEELKKVKKYFIWAIVGALIIFGSDLFLGTIEDTIEKSKLLKN